MREGGVGRDGSQLEPHQPKRPRPCNLGLRDNPKQLRVQSAANATDTAAGQVRAGPPATTTRAAAPSTVSGHCGESRATRAAAPSAVSGHCAGHSGESRAPSGDHARRSPFCSLWTGPPAATTRAAGTSAVSGHCAGHCGESRAPSGDHARRSADHARRSPFCSLWTLRSVDM